MTESDLKALEEELRRAVAREVRLLPEGRDRFRVFTPFQLDDGDHLSIVLRRNNGHWEYSDEAHTLMHLSYFLSEGELLGATRQRVIGAALAQHDIQNNDGELVLPITTDDWGPSLFSYVQALLRVSDLSVYNRERVKSTFVDDAKDLIRITVPAERCEFQWHERTLDPDAKYRVDCRINGQSRPLMVFLLANDSRTRDATITLLKLESWQVPHRSLAIFQDQERISRSVLARLTDIVDRQFSSLSERERISDYLAKQVNEP